MTDNRYQENTLTLLVAQEDEPGILHTVSEIARKNGFNIEKGITHTILNRAVVFLCLTHGNEQSQDENRETLERLISDRYPESSVIVSEAELDDTKDSKWQPFIWRVQFTCEDFPGLLANSMEAMRSPDGVDVDIVSWSGTGYRFSESGKPLFVMAFAIRPTKNLNKETFRRRFRVKLEEICGRPVDLENLVIESL